MKVSSKILLGFMLVMMICCVSAVSATDINGTDDAIITDDIAVDDVSEIVEEEEIDDVSQDIVEENTDDTNDNVVKENLRTNIPPRVNGQDYSVFFDTNGNLENLPGPSNLTFTGDFVHITDNFGNFKINRQVDLDISLATFHNIGIEITGDYIHVNGGTFTSDGTVDYGQAIYVNATGVEINDVTMNLVAPEDSDFYAIDVEDSQYAKIYYSVINYTCDYNNTASYNYVIKSKNSDSIIIQGNTITANLPLKKVNWNLTGSIDADYVAGVAIENCTHAHFYSNELNVEGIRRAGAFPTLDALIITKTDRAIIRDNVINEKDTVTIDDEYSYLYGIDVYSCPSINIINNTVTMNANQSGGHIEGNGTGAAYCIQLSGNHTNVLISDNTLTTKNKGPNLGIYSQNANAYSQLKIEKNRINVTGKAGSDPWSLVSGIEVQDSSAEVSDNIITVNNIAGYTPDNYAFGISYAQWINQTHVYNIHNNHVNVINGDYAIYLLNDTDVSGQVYLNEVTASGNATRHGDIVVFAPSTSVRWNY